MKLYELISDYNRVLEMSDELDQAALLDTLESIEESIEEKVENTAKVIRSWEAEVKALREEEERFAKRRKTRENSIKSTKLWLQNQLEFAGIDKVKGSVLTVSLRNNPAKVHVTDDKLVPLEFKILKEPEISKSEIAKALKRGEEVPGAELVQTRGLSIK